MKNKIPSILMYLLAAWFVAVGIGEIMLNKVEDFPWVAALIDSADASVFDRPLDILTTGLGLLLVFVGSVLGVLAGAMTQSGRVLSATCLLAAGASLTQAFTLYSLGAPLPSLVIPGIAVLLVIISYVLARGALLEIEDYNSES